MELPIKPRAYQQAILETCKKKSCLVILPTGTGKTLIAVLLAIERFKQYPLEKILLLSPTKPLIEQHFKTFQNLLPDGRADMQLFTGKTPAEKRKKIWQTAEFIFSTPQCIANDIKKNLYTLEDVSLLVEDEAHRCLKNYAYNFIAQKYKQQANHPHILGLTASPGADKQTIQNVCNNLGIKEVEIRTRESEDVKPYIQELEFEKIAVNLPSEFEEIRQLLINIYEKKVDELKNRQILFGQANKKTLLDCQKRIFKALNTNKSMNLYAAASVCAQAIKLQHALELLETQTLESFLTYMRSLFKQAEQQASKASQKIASNKQFNKAYTLALSLEKEHPKLDKLVEIINQNKDKKILIFSQYRDTVNKIKSSLPKQVKPEIFVGQAKKTSGNKTTGLNQEQQKQLIEKFASGEINCLISTSIGEEGLDIPEVDLVIFYEPIPSAIRAIQRRGRTARLQKGALKILVTKNTRDESYYYASRAKEKKMHKAIKDIKAGLSNQEKLFK
ncbi:MAG: DEAD/DEAH box helicase [Candidatus Nanoarchaeia archaeon]